MKSLIFDDQKCNYILEINTIFIFALILAKKLNNVLFKEVVLVPKRERRIIARYKVIIPVIIPQLRVKVPIDGSSSLSESSPEAIIPSNAPKKSQKSKSQKSRRIKPNKSRKSRKSKRSAGNSSESNTKSRKGFKPSARNASKSKKRRTKVSTNIFWGPSSNRNPKLSSKNSLKPKLTARNSSKHQNPLKTSVRSDSDQKTTIESMSRSNSALKK